MKNFRLYVILDRGLLRNKDIIGVAKEVIEGCACVIQYRDKISSQTEILKNAERLKKLNFPLIINDYPRIAKAVDALGVHLGQNDMDTKSARKILGDKIIGRSTHNLKEAIKAQGEGVDYIGIGPIFSTSTKKDAVPIGLDILKEVAKAIHIPVFAIGGITLSDIDSVLSTGVNRVAIASAILCSDNIKETIQQFCKKLVYEPDRIGAKK